MFNKPFKVKSNNQLKGTERKKLCEEILKEFSALSEEDIQNLLPKKETITVMKVVTHMGQTGKIYSASKTPVFIQFEVPQKKYLPTIYTLWKHPTLLPSFTIFPPVVNALIRGADLMIPGIDLNGPATIRSYGKLQKGALVLVNTSDNMAAVAIGFTAHSSEDLYMSGGHGKCVEILHVLNDHLSQLDDTLTRPQLNFSEIINEKSPVDEVENNLVEGVENLGNDNSDEAETQKQELENSADADIETESVQIPELNPVEEMDNLLEYCFLKACKTNAKSIQLPVLSSNFFKNFVLPACPAGKSLDVRTSSFKKLSVFLSSLKSKGLIDTSILKGVESLIAIKHDHPVLRSFVILEEVEKIPTDDTSAPVITECYKVTATVLPVLSKYGHEKGEIMKRAEIRKCFTEYVKKEKLQDNAMFRVDPTLAGIFKSPENVVTMKMEDGINKFIGKMTLMKEIAMGKSRILHSGKIEPIDITVATRNGNKKVTLINNVEVFGIKLEEFSKECQGIGASATITEVPGKKTPSVLVQGNQVVHVHKLLTEKYRINKSYIRGLELAPKKKK